jgi:hypothetical protein
MISRRSCFCQLLKSSSHWRRKSLNAFAFSVFASASVFSLTWLFSLVSLTLITFAATSANPAYAASLGEAEVRSWLGESLVVRIPVASPAGEPLDASCIVISRESEPFSLARDIRVELVNTDNVNVKRFVLRTSSTINEPFIRLVVRFDCASQGALTREYTLLLDPRPEIAPATNAISTKPAATTADVTLQSQTATSATTAIPAPTTSPRVPPKWLTGTNNPDTLASIAEGIYPKSIKRKARYIAALRQLNPNLATIADDAPLPPSFGLTLPDLKALSTTRQVVPTRAARATNNNARPAAPLPTARVPSPAKTTRTTPATKTSPASPKSTTNTARPQFELRISGSEMDLSRSASVTDEQRAILREKQFLLDADDQIAQFLALKNTVAQLEKRLNEVQLKMSTAPASAAAPVTRVADPPKASDSLTVSTTQAWIDRFSFGWLFMGVILLTIIISIVIWLKRREAADVEANTAASPLYPSDTAVPHNVALNAPLNSPYNTRASNELSTHAELEQDEFSNWAKTPTANPALTDTQTNTIKNEFNRRQDEADDIALALLRSKTNPADDAAKNAKPREVTLATLSADHARALQMPASGMNSLVLDLNIAETPATEAEHANIFDDSTAQFTLDSTSSNTVDFLLDDVGEPEILFGQPMRKAESDDDARMRRMQYMYERYPELKTKVVSIDNPDSIINAARLYVEESSIQTTQDRRSGAGITTSDGAQKATELLAYALEERPQETRFWLAQFQVFRNANMADEYSELATKFNILFGHTVDWPLIQEIGRSLTPANPLFAPLPDSLINDAASLGGSLTGKLKMANWLNVPSREVNKITDKLALELRNALLNPHA